MFPLCGLTRCVGLFFYCNNPGRRPVRASQPVKAHCFAYPQAKKEEIPWKKARQRFQLPLASVIGGPLQAATMGQQMMATELMQKTPEQLGVADGESGDSQKAEK